MECGVSEDDVDQRLGVSGRETGGESRGVFAAGLVEDESCFGACFGRIQLARRLESGADMDNKVNEAYLRCRLLAGNLSNVPKGITTDALFNRLGKRLTYTHLNVCTFYRSSLPGFSRLIVDGHDV